MYLHSDHGTADPLEDWLAGGGAGRWVAGHGGHWSHDDWLALLTELRPAGLRATEERMLGALLEEAKTQYDNLRRWQETGGPRRWVEGNGGSWDHDDWVELIWTLQADGYWPIDPEALGRLLEEEKRRRTGLRDWVSSGKARQWVAERQGHWGPEEVVALARGLERSAGGPIRLDELIAVLERYRSAWWGLQSWLRTGGARLWVEQHEDGWSHDEWLVLVCGLEQLGYTVELEWLGQAIEKTRQGYQNVRRWQLSGSARRWVESQQGEWDHTTWLALLREVEHAFGPIDPGRLGLVLEQEQKRYHDLRREQESATTRAREVVCGSGWYDRDWLELLAWLGRAIVWPTYAEAVAGALERLRAEYHNARRWPGLQAA